ncbi:MAG: hypothetical protein LC667_15655 [Thioalkalivibrio sp.]|nr:hypothetical protein [Thioalkalivibrio sp.]
MTRSESLLVTAEHDDELAAAVHEIFEMTFLATGRGPHDRFESACE